MYVFLRQRPSWPGTCYVDQARLELTEIHMAATQKLGLKAFPTLPGLFFYFYSHIQVCVQVAHMSKVASVARRGQWILQSWSYRSGGAQNTAEAVPILISRTIHNTSTIFNCLSV